MSHHKSWFPLIVVALSLLLGGFIYTVFQNRINVSSRSVVSPVTVVDYQSQVHKDVSGLSTALLEASTVEEKIVLLTSVREQLLTLLVPPAYKDAHLEMVMILSQWIVGYQGETQKVSSAESRWQLLVDQYPWIE